MKPSLGQKRTQENWFEALSENWSSPVTAVAEWAVFGAVSEEDEPEVKTFNERERSLWQRIV